VGAFAGHPDDGRVGGTVPERVIVEGCGGVFDGDTRRGKCADGGAGGGGVVGLGGGWGLGEEGWSNGEEEERGEDGWAHL